MVYVPVGFTDLRDQYLTDDVMVLVNDGLVDTFDARPEYAGDSHVPRAIVVDLSHSERDGRLTKRLEVW